MAARYRSDQVGSYLRSQELKDAHTAYRQGNLPLERLRPLEDREILRLLDMQKRVGIDVASDGEYRRGGWWLTRRAKSGAEGRLGIPLAGNVFQSVLFVEVVNVAVDVAAPSQTQQLGEENLRTGQHRVHVEPSPRWVRVKFNGEVIADSKRAVLLRETAHLPVYYFPPEDVRQDVLEPTDHHTRCPFKGEASYWTVRVGDAVAENAMWGYLDPLPEREDIRGYRAFYWGKMDAWFEEEEQIFAHPRDPYHRVDVVHSSRHVKVEIDGKLVAESHQPRLLFETGLPTRYYLPVEDVRMDLLEATETRSVGPYKGEASYWRLAGGASGRDVAWSYQNPIQECPRIKGLIAFFNERVDALHVDGEVQARPRTAWS